MSTLPEPLEFLKEKIVPGNPWAIFMAFKDVLEKKRYDEYLPYIDLIEEDQDDDEDQGDHQTAQKRKADLDQWKMMRKNELRLDLVAYWGATVSS